jgi:hypothetical protein
MKAFDIRRMACVIGGDDGTNAAKNDTIGLHGAHRLLGGYGAGAVCGRAGGVVAEVGGGVVFGSMGEESAREDD